MVREAVFFGKDFLVSQYQHLLGHHGKKLRIISGERRGDIQAIWNFLFFPNTPSGLESKYRMVTVSILEWEKKPWGDNDMVSPLGPNLPSFTLSGGLCNIVPDTNGTSDIHLVPERPRIEVNSYKSSNNMSI